MTDALTWFDRHVTNDANCWDTIANLMDDEIREAVHAAGTEDPRDFLVAYCEKHREKFGEDFTIS